jgi:serpin B
MRTGGLRRGRAGIAAAAAVLAAAAIAVAVQRLDTPDSPSARTPPSARLPAGVHTGAQVGSAVELVSRTGPSASASPSAVAGVATAERDFAAAFLAHIAADATGNESVAPASLAIALAMLDNGARGPTRTEIAAALRSSSLTTAELNEGWAGLAAQWSAAARSAGIEFSSANSLWQQRGLPLRRDFMATLARYFASGVWQVDFATDMSAALSAMNQWTAQHTKGKIAKLFDSLDPTTVLVLANAVYFSAKWQTPFDPAASEPAPFAAADGSRATATFMTSPQPAAAARTSTYQAAQLPYAGGRFAALAIMPTQGPVSDFARSLDGATLSRIAASLSTPLPVKLPRFTTTSTIELRPVLDALGIHAALSDSADFAAMSPTPMQIGQAVQRVYVKVGEKGTEAAAATGIGMVPTMAGPPFDGITFDHPFLFLIRDAETGAVLFASAINRPDPAA